MNLSKVHISTQVRVDIPDLKSTIRLMSFVLQLQGKVADQVGHAWTGSATVGVKLVKTFDKSLYFRPKVMCRIFCFCH